MITIDFKTWVYSILKHKKVQSPARKFIVSPDELKVINDVIDLYEDTDYLQESIKKTLKPYTKKYENDPDMPDGTLCFMLFEREYTLLSQMIVEVLVHE